MHHLPKRDGHARDRARGGRDVPGRYDLDDDPVSAGMRHRAFPSQRKVRVGLRQYRGRAVAVRTLRHARRPERRCPRGIQQRPGLRRRVHAALWRRWLRRGLANVLSPERAGPTQPRVRFRRVAHEKLVAVLVLLKSAIMPTLRWTGARSIAGARRWSAAAEMESRLARAG